MKMTEATVFCYTGSEQPKLSKNYYRPPRWTQKLKCYTNPSTHAYTTGPKFEALTQPPSQIFAKCSLTKWIVAKCNSTKCNVAKCNVAKCISTKHNEVK